MLLSLDQVQSMSITLPTTDIAWLLELSSGLDEAIADTEDDEVKMTKDLAEQISKHIKVIIYSATRASPDS